jgi:nuclear pore complex protein Nup37
VGNDLVCKIWDIEADRTVSEFKLTSPGMSVSFHPNQMSQLLVTELSGIIRLYNIETKSPILSLECSGKTLVHADWSKANGLKVGGVGGSNWYLWDMSQYSVPYETQPVANGGPLTRFKWCNTSDSVFATLGMKGLFQIHHYNHQKIPVTSSLPVIKDISWHPSLPVTFSLTNNQIVSWEVSI